jgi:hypothetical protein
MVDVALVLGHGARAATPLEDVAADHTAEDADAAVTRALTSRAGRTVGAASIVLVSGTVVATSTGSSHDSMIAAPPEPALTATRETPEKLYDRQQCQPKTQPSRRKGDCTGSTRFERLAGRCVGVWLGRTRFHLR